MRATLTRLCPELTRPAYSSIRFGLLPAAWTTAGRSMSRGILCLSFQFLVATLMSIKARPAWFITASNLSPNSPADSASRVGTQFMHMGLLLFSVLVVGSIPQLGE
jgi:hypothetical protein